MNAMQIIEELKQERFRLEAAIRALESLGGTQPARGPRRRRHMSAEARKKIGAAMKKAWAERKRKAA